MKLLAPKQFHVWHIRVQRWANGRRLRRVPYRIVADSKTHAMDVLMKILPRTRGQVVTRCVEGKAV